MFAQCWCARDNRRSQHAPKKESVVVSYWQHKIKRFFSAFLKTIKMMTTCLMLVSRSWRTMQWSPRYSRCARQVTRFSSGWEIKVNAKYIISCSHGHGHTNLLPLPTSCVTLWEYISLNLDKCVEDVTLPLNGSVVSWTRSEELQSH